MLSRHRTEMVYKFGRYVRRFLQERVRQKFEEGLVEQVSGLSPDQLYKCISWDVSLWELIPEKKKVEWRAEAANIKDEYFSVIQSIDGNKIMAILEKERPDLLAIIQNTSGGVAWLDKVLSDIRTGLDLDATAPPS